MKRGVSFLAAAMLLVNGAFFARDSVACVAGQQCDPTPTPAPTLTYYLPVPGGTSVYVTQGNVSDGDHTLANGSAYAYDFAMAGNPEFTVVAARQGTVIGVEQNFTDSCLDGSCWHRTNFVLIDHHDGTSALYLHLAAGSVLVRVGQQVGAGAWLGKAGSTGWSSGNHLHFQVETTPAFSLWTGTPEETNAPPPGIRPWWWTESRQIRFEDAGMPVPRSQPYVSGNV